MNREQPPYIKYVDRLVQENKAMKVTKAAILEDVKKRQAISPLKIGKR